MTLIKSNKLPVKHPGVVFYERCLKARGIEKKVAAQHLNMSAKQIYEFTNGRSSVSTKLALKLYKATGISAEFWLNLQHMYDLYMARDEVIEAQPLYAFG